MRYLILAGFLMGVQLFTQCSTTTAGDDKWVLEPGFSLLFNGKDLNGWRTKKGDSLEGKIETMDKRFRADRGLLVIDDFRKKGDAIADSHIYTTQEFGKDVHIKLDFLPGDRCNNDSFLRGIKFDLTLSSFPQSVKEGQWNQLEIIVQGDKAKYRINGIAVHNAATRESSSPFGLRAEVGQISYRRIRWK